MFKKLFFLFTVLLICSGVSAQEITLSEDIAYIDGIEYLKLQQVNETKYIISNQKTGEKILEVELFKAFNQNDKRYHHLPKITFAGFEKPVEFEVDIQNSTGLIRFLHDWELIYLNGNLNVKQVKGFLGS